MEQIGYGEQFSKLTIDSLKQMYKAVEVRLPQIDTELSNLKIKIKVQKTIIDKLKEQMKGLDKQQSKLIAAAILQQPDLVPVRHRSQPEKRR